MTDSAPPDCKPSKFPASMTAPQFIALLDEMVTLALAKRTSALVDDRSRYETFYRISVSDIYEADHLFQSLDHINADHQKQSKTR